MVTTRYEIVSDDSSDEHVIKIRLHKESDGRVFVQVWSYKQVKWINAVEFGNNNEIYHASLNITELEEMGLTFS